MKFVVMETLKIIGLHAPSGFSIKEHLAKYPASIKIVLEKEKTIIKYINSFYQKEKPKYHEWYAGMTDKTHHRYNAHKKVRNIDELPNYKKFYMHSMSNARSLEVKLFKKFKLGNSPTMGGIYIRSKYVYVFHEPSAKLQGLI
jgi:hypothetical protein